MILENLKHLIPPKHYKVNLKWFLRVTKISEEIQNFLMALYLSLNTQDRTSPTYKNHWVLLALLWPLTERLPRAYSSTADSVKLYEDRKFYISVTMKIMFWNQYSPCYTWILPTSSCYDLSLGERSKHNCDSWPWGHRMSLSVWLRTILDVHAGCGCIWWALCVAESYLFSGLRV